MYRRIVYFEVKETYKFLYNLKLEIVKIGFESNKGGPYNLIYS